MAQIIYLMNPQPQIMILISLKILESFLTCVEVIFFRKETKKITKELYKKETAYNSLKEKDILTNKEKIVLKNINKYLKKLNNDLKKLQKYQDNITYGLDYLFKNSMKKIITKQ